MFLAAALAFRWPDVAASACMTFSSRGAKVTETYLWQPATTAGNRYVVIKSIKFRITCTGNFFSLSKIICGIAVVAEAWPTTR